MNILTHHGDTGQVAQNTVRADAGVRSPTTELLKLPGVFRVGDLSQAGDGFIASGFPTLDHALSGGWPLARLTEVLCSHTGIGELSLMLSTLPKRAVTRSLSLSAHSTTKTPTSAAESTSPRALFVSQPTLPVGMPCVAYAPALEQAGVDLKALAFVATSSVQQTLWVLEQTLLSGAARTVLAWITERPHDVALRRISQAARKSHSLCFLMRPRSAEKYATPAELRIALSPAIHDANTGMIELRLLKRRGLLHETTLLLNPRMLPCVTTDRFNLALTNHVSGAAMPKRATSNESARATATISPFGSAPKIRERSFIIER